MIERSLVDGGPQDSPSAAGARHLAGGTHGAVRVALVTNIPAPYRIPVYELLAQLPGIELKLFFCSGREPDREWDLEVMRAPHRFLREGVILWRKRFIHVNPDVWSGLREFGPDVVVTTGFNPTHLLAFVFARLHGARHVAMTDGTRLSESSLTFVHRWLRRRVYARSHAFVGASDGSFALYRQYGVPDAKLFKSHLCADNTAFAAAARVPRDFDLIYCGRFVAGKLPLFAIEVAAATAQRLGRRVRMLLVGSGELDARMRRAADLVDDLVEAHFTGFARQGELPAHYARARVLLFPTAGDTWGVVANEACAAGLAVIVSPRAGVAGELVRDGENGRVLPLDSAQWADAAAALLRDHTAWQHMSARSLELVRPYTHTNAAQGLAAAVGHAAQRAGGKPRRAAGKGRRVVLMQRRLTSYREPLFERMRVLLALRGIRFELLHGDATPGESLKDDSASIPWAQHLRCHYWLGRRLCWQWAWPSIRGADLVIVTHENKLLFNHLLAGFRLMVPLALWGHGRNFQSVTPKGLPERLKRWSALRADWWFAYTEVSAEVVRSLGFARERITVLNNTIDTAALQADLAALAHVDDDTLRRELGLAHGPVGLVLGSLYADKRIGFVLEAARCVRQRVPDFQLLIVGDGPDRTLVQAAARVDGWVHWSGARRGLDKARCLRVAALMLNPFGVGLVVIESFVVGVPMVVTDSHGHGPEFAYLQPGVNALLTPAVPLAYAAEVAALLRDDARRAALARAGASAAQALSLEGMAQNFCDGISRCLNDCAPGRGASSRVRATDLAQ